MLSGYGYLFKKTTLPKASLNSLFRVEGFVSELDKINNKGKSINDSDIYNVAKKMYFPKRANGERSGSAKILYDAVRRFSKVLETDENAWKQEFMEYIDNNMWHSQAFN